MIIVDTSEEKTTSNTPKVPNAKSVPWLEAETGADLVITPLEMPFTKKTMKHHSKAGALFVQVKNGHDLASSVGTRINTSLGKMSEVASRREQRILLFVGIFTEGEDGQAKINGQPVMSGISYAGIIGAISKFQDRGGRFESISRRSFFLKWLEMKERHLKEYQEEPVKQVFPNHQTLMDTSGPLQIPEVITDARTMFLALPGIGPKILERLWEHVEGDPIFLLEIITNLDYAKIPVVRGFGIGKVTKIREFLGIPPEKNGKFKTIALVEHQRVGE